MSNQSADRRPQIRITRRSWGGTNGHQTPGILFVKGTGIIVAHYTPTEALQLADQLVDLAEKVEQEQTR